MRYVRILLIFFQRILEHKGNSFVFFLTGVVPPLITLMFWNGALGENQSISGWNITSLSEYYLLLITAGAFLMSHIENDVSKKDVKNGELANFLVKPFSYYLLKFFYATPSRVLQASYGLAILFIAIIFFNVNLELNISNEQLILGFLVFLLGYLISFTFKMIVGLSALWMTDISGFRELIEVVILILAGFILPLTLLPNYLQVIANALPFSYMIYYPVIAIQGNLSLLESFRILVIQTVWLVILYCTYKSIFFFGIRKFTGVGQ